MEKIELDDCGIINNLNDLVNKMALITMFNARLEAVKTDIEGMKANNQWCAQIGNSDFYTEEAFNSVAERMYKIARDIENINGR